MPRGSILVVDDEAEIREGLEALLTSEDFEVTLAETGESGLQKIEERPFDLILLDVSLPDRNGIELLRDIHRRDPYVSVILITAYGSIHLFPILPHNVILYAVLRRAHTVLAYLLFLTFLAHLGAVLFHTWVVRDGTFSRMAPWTAH